MLSKRAAGILIIVVSFVGMVIASVVDQGGSPAPFVVALALFSILVIVLGPWVLGN